MNRTPKRKRGAQPGNQNARTHRFYSRTLTPTETSALWPAANLQSADPAIAIIRVKLGSLLSHDPHNPRALAAATRLLTKWYRDRYGFAADLTAVWQAVRTFVENLAIAASPVQSDRPASPDESSPSPRIEPNLAHGVPPGIVFEWAPASADNSLCAQRIVPVLSIESRSAAGPEPENGS